MNVLRFSAVLLSLLGACATQHEVQRTQQGTQALRTDIANVEASLADVRREMAELRGEVETVRHRLERVARERTVPEVQDLEARIAKLEQRPAPPLRQDKASADPLPPVSDQEFPSDPLTQPVPAHKVEPSPQMLREQQEYALALKLLRDEDYERALQQFRTFQRTYPASEMADDALYWIGEIYFIQQDYSRAILALNDVILQYGKGDRRPDAFVRQAEAFLEIGDRRSTRLILRKVIDDYPGSAVIPKAESLLQFLEP